jgi:hypothetical protein
VRRKLLVGLIAAGAVTVAAAWLPTAPTFFSSSSTQALQAAAPEKRAESAEGDARFSALPARAPLGELRGALFAAPAPPPKPAAAAPQPAAKPTAPPMPYRVAGTVVHDGITKVVLAKGNAVLPIEPGEALDGGYRVESIGPGDIVLLYVPLGVRERLPITPTAAADAPAEPVARAASAPPQTAAAGAGSRPARVRWDGPERVQAGKNFNVALKVTSDEPLRASPLQMSFDPQLLEAVAVHPGSFFGRNGFFNYHVDPKGSIVISASGPGNVAADAELVILTFKPIRSAAAAEVKISSLVLQGAVGKPIAVEPVSVFRTGITP